MTGFAAEWLALRAPADTAARDGALLHAAAAFAGDGLISDIGGGSGATFRALAPLAPAARWRVLDADETLLSQLPDDPKIEPVAVDLAVDPGAIFAKTPALVAASAFFDLASAEWIDDFAARLARSGAPLYAALTYDGRERWAPEPPHESEALAAFHADMRRDKGLGSALGPGAHRALATALARFGYQVSEAQSDWRLSRPRFASLIVALAQGGGDALSGALPDAAHREWLTGRIGASDVLIGHMDLLAIPPR